MRILRVAAMAAALLVGLSTPASAQGFDFLSVKKWKGTIKATGQGSGTSGVGGLTTTWSVSHGGEAEVTLDRWDAGIRAWVGTVTGKGSVREEYIISTPQCSSVTKKIGEGDLAKDQFGEPRQFFMTVDGDQYRIYPNDPYIETKNSSEICGTPFLTIDAAELWFPATRHAIGGTFPKNGNTLSGTLTYSIPGADPMGDLKWEISYSFHPVDTEELEVVIEPEQYETWIPQGTRDELEPGNHIGIRAKLRAKDGSPTNRKASRFVFTVNPSREPGVALNYPIRKPNSGAPGPDLAFTVEQNSMLDVDIDGLRAATREGEIIEARAVVSSFDFGAWGELRVTATLEDGTSVVGRYKGEVGLRLPKRPADSFIADAWKDAAGVSGVDVDDKDSTPVGDSHAGDGLTLYEEYRGFFENGKHLRTDPLRKDLFILDEMGGKTKPGIALFVSVTGLQVHHELTDTEMQRYPEPHVINANYAKGAHTVDQHGVVLVETDRVKEGALAWSEKYPDVIGTPKTVDLVGVSVTPGEGLGNGTVPYFDKMIAHELLHTVNVPHHGDSDYRITMNVKRTPSGKYVLRNRPSDTLYRLYDEATDTDVAQPLGEALYARFESANALPLFEQEVDSNSGLWIGDLVVGAPGGQHSGDDECLMRYEFARAYELKGRADAYYTFNGQHRGAMLCEAEQGTGANDDGHMPQSRHGKAANGRCKSRVCVNDLHEHAKELREGAL